MLWNLLRNAIKFTPEKGNILLRCEQNGDAILSVSDTGIGVGTELLARIFEAFEKGSADSPGFGLGLSIAKALVEAHGGRIEVESLGRNRGTTFLVYLPLADTAGSGSTVRRSSDTGAQRAEQSSSARSAAIAQNRAPRIAQEESIPEHAPTPGGAASAARTAAAGRKNSPRHEPGAARAPLPAEASGLGGLHILLVENHADSAQLLAQLLSTAGCCVTVAESAAAALNAVEQHHFDLLISDLGLPDGNGCELMRQVADRGLTLQGIALSGFGSTMDMSQSAEAGFREHLVKPVAFEQLRAAIGRVVP